MPTITLRNSEFSFLHVSLVHESETTLAETDLLTWRHLITTALTRDHGLLGSSCHVDILHHYAIKEGSDESVLIRIPKKDKRMVWNAVSGFVDEKNGRGFRVLGVSDHLTALM